MSFDFDPTGSVLAGLSTEQLQANLAAAQAAYTALMTGKQVATASYAQGDGSQTVSYRATDVGNLTAFIRLLQAQLGLICRPRRPVRFNFR